MSSRIVPYDEYSPDYKDIEVWGRKWTQTNRKPQRYLREKNGEWKLLGPVGDTTPINDSRITRALENERKKWHTQ